MIRLGSTFKYVREKKGLTQRAAAEILGISDVHMCNLERDKARPSPELLEKVNQKWGIDVYILSWCLHGDSQRLPRSVRLAMDKLANLWRVEFEKQRIL